MLARLAHATDLDGFRAQARALLARGVRPEQVTWRTDAAGDLLAQDDTLPPATAAASARVPAAFVALCRDVVLHADPQRFALLYRLAWRLQHEPALRHDPLDPDWLQAQGMAKAVRRASHKMHAFLRFRQVDDGQGADDPLHVAWFESEHHVVAANGDWFRRRFANMRWAILSPECCLHWDRHRLTQGPAARREQAPAADAGEQLWLTYYHHIFNPARLKLAMMAKEMPRKFWANLPEAALIAPLAAGAAERSGRMVEQAPPAPNRRIPVLPLPAAPQGADTLSALHAQVQDCRACPIGASATHGVCGEGPLQPRRMVVGEQPGDQEDLQGRPFVGPAGQLFDRALRQGGIERDALFVTNAVRHFKYELRGRRRIHKTPSQQEAATCAQWLAHEIALVRPQALVALGATAARALLGRPVAVQSERGQWFERADSLRVFVTVHPSSILRLPPPERDGAFAQFADELAAACR